MLRRLFFVFALVIGVSAWADTEFMGMYLQGQRIGVVSSTRVDLPDGTVRSLSTTKLGANLLGQAMQMDMSSESITRSGRLVRQVYDIQTGGRSQKVTAVFGVAKIDVTKVADKVTTTKQLDVPKDGALIDDPTFGLVGKGLPAVGTKTSFYVFDPTLLSLIKNETEFLGAKEVDFDGKHYSGFLLRVKDPRANSDVYLDKQGNVLLVIGLFGITMKPISREEATGTSGYLPSIDLASVSRIEPDRPIGNQAKLKSLTLKLTGKPVDRLVNDGYYQTVKRSPSGITLVIAPPSPRSGVMLKNLAKLQPKFSRPGLYLPSDDPKLKTVATGIVVGARDGWDAAQRITKYVHRIMTPDASIAMLRDAREVFKTKVGVCRDYAVLCATLMRSVGIPAKLVTGAVYADGAFYYHAWVESWDGHAWIAMDPTLTGGRADATHIKFAEGDAETAFVSFTLDGVKIAVVSERR